MSKKSAVQGGVAVAEKKKVEKPRMFKVLLHNDDFTPMDFVIVLLMEVFHKNQEEAVQITYNVHVKGRGVCGVYPRDVAESKVSKVMRISKENGHPLLCSMEPE